MFNIHSHEKHNVQLQSTCIHFYAHYYTKGFWWLILDRVATYMWIVKLKHRYSIIHEECNLIAIQTMTLMQSTSATYNEGRVKVRMSMN